MPPYGHMPPCEAACMSASNICRSALRRAYVRRGTEHVALLAHAPHATASHPWRQSLGCSNTVGKSALKRQRPNCRLHRLSPCMFLPVDTNLETQSMMGVRRTPIPPLSPLVRLTSDALPADARRMKRYIAHASPALASRIHDSDKPNKARNRRHRGNRLPWVGA